MQHVDRKAARVVFQVEDPMILRPRAESYLALDFYPLQVLLRSQRLFRRSASRLCGGCPTQTLQAALSYFYHSVCPLAPPLHQNPLPCYPWLRIRSFGKIPCPRAVKKAPPVRAGQTPCHHALDPDWITSAGAITQGDLAPAAIDRYAFSVRESELRSTATGSVTVGIEVRATAGGNLEPAIPVIPGAAPLGQHREGGRAFALFELGHVGLYLLEIAGTNSGAYSLLSYQR